jgi:uncharacterized membrane protein
MMKAGGPHDDRGFTSVTFMLMLMVLVLAVGAISIDLWHLVSEHREVAGVVDGAAISAAGAVDESALRVNPPVLQIDGEKAAARACQYLRTRGGVGACPGPGAEVVVGADWVSVTMSRPVDLTLLRLFAGLSPDADSSPIEVSATATAAIATR